MAGVKIIVNPISGKGRALRMARRVADRLRPHGIEATVHESFAPGEASRMARESSASSILLCAGGDGSINAVLNGLPLPNANPIGIIPSGTANVLAKELRLPRDPEGLARMVIDRRATTMDVGVNAATGQKFLLMAGAGFDAAVVHRISRGRDGSISMSRYIPLGLAEYAQYRPYRIRVEIDGRTVTPDSQFALVSNVRGYGGPMEFTGGARSDDRLFDVFLMSTSHKRDLFRLFPSALIQRVTGHPITMPGVRVERGRHVRLSSDEPVPLQIDGDPAGFLPAEFSFLPTRATILHLP